MAETKKTTKRHSVTYNSIRRNIVKAHPDWSEKRVNITAIYATRKADAERRAKAKAKKAAEAAAEAAMA